MSSVVIQFLQKCLIKLLALAVRGSDLLLANKFCFSHKAGLYITQIRHVFRFNINRLWQDMLYIYSRIYTYYNDLVIETNCICTRLVRIRFLLLPYFFSTNARSLWYTVQCCNFRGRIFSNLTYLHFFSILVLFKL